MNAGQRFSPAFLLWHCCGFITRRTTLSLIDHGGSEFVRKTRALGSAADTPLISSQSDAGLGADTDRSSLPGPSIVRVNTVCTIPTVFYRLLRMSSYNI